MPPGRTQRGSDSERPDRIRAKMMSLYAPTAAPAARVAVAKDYLLSAAKWLQRRDPARANQVLDAMARDLVRAGDTLLAEHLQQSATS